MTKEQIEKDRQERTAACIKALDELMKKHEFILDAEIQRTRKKDEAVPVIHDTKKYDEPTATEPETIVPNP